MTPVLFTTTRPHADRHRFISARRLQCSPFTLALRNNRYERQPAGGLSQHFQIHLQGSLKCRPQFSRCIISISLSHHLARMANTHDHELRPCCLPTPMALASGGSPMFPLVVHQPASPSIWPAVQSLRRGLSTNPGATMWCVCGCS